MCRTYSMTDVNRHLENPVEATTIVQNFVLLLVKHVLCGLYVEPVTSLENAEWPSIGWLNVPFDHNTCLTSNNTKFCTMVVASTGFSKSLVTSVMLCPAHRWMR
jgi:hypothetical protein